jgi:hypothetical protein
LLPKGFSQPLVVRFVWAKGGTALLVLTLSSGVLKDLRGLPPISTGLGALCMAASPVFFYDVAVKTGVAVGATVAIGKGERNTHPSPSGGEPVKPL